mmetsp:Transcript_15390/g.41316  ORF Transcript_15390/g.41316 Transcript_15390/m.41316 type:complete len:121 (-) Transcript_15390:1422-1784(-)
MERAKEVLFANILTVVSSREEIQHVKGLGEFRFMVYFLKACLSARYANLFPWHLLREQSDGDEHVSHETGDDSTSNAESSTLSRAAEAEQQKLIRDVTSLDCDKSDALHMTTGQRTNEHR